MKEVKYINPIKNDPASYLTRTRLVQEKFRMNRLRARIHELAKKHGSLRAAARVLEIDHAYLSRLQDGSKLEPSDEILRKLRLKRVVTYIDQ